MSKAIRVKLSEEQLKELSKSLRTCKTAEEMLGNVVMSVAEKIAEEQDRLWDQAFKLGGEDVSRDTHKAVIEWVSQELVFNLLKKKVD